MPMDDIISISSSSSTSSTVSSSSSSSAIVHLKSYSIDLTESVSPIREERATAVSPPSPSLCASPSSHSCISFLSDVASFTSSTVNRWKMRRRSGNSGEIEQRTNAALQNITNVDEQER